MLRDSLSRALEIRRKYKRLIPHFYRLWMDKESSCKLCRIRWWVLQRRKRVSTGLSISPCSRWCLWPRSKLQIWHGCLFWMEYHGWSNCSWRYRNRRLCPFIQMGLWTNSASLECLFKHKDILITWKYKLDNIISTVKLWAVDRSIIQFWTILSKGHST